MSNADQLPGDKDDSLEPMTEHLRHDHQVLLKSLISGKLPRNLHWKDVIDLIGQIGTVEPHGGDEFNFVVGGNRELFKKPHTSELDVEDASRLRKFLKQNSATVAVGDSCEARRIVVVVDHHGAHIYKDIGQSTPEAEATVQPHDPFHFHHHLVHKKEANYRGERVPEETSYYDEIAKHLADALEIVLIGHGTGKSSAADYLAEYLKLHHFEIFQKIVGRETADLSALTQPEIEALAKKHFLEDPQSSPTKTDRYDRTHVSEKLAS
jgi:hypothetical protein